MINSIIVGVETVKYNRYTLQRIVERANRILITLNEMIRKESEKLEDVKTIKLEDLPLPDYIKRNMEALIAVLKETDEFLKKEAPKKFMISFMQRHTTQAKITELLQDITGIASDLNLAMEIDTKAWIEEDQGDKRRDIEAIDETLKNLVDNDYKILNSLELKQQEYFEAMEAIQKRLNEHMELAIERAFMEKALACLQRESKSTTLETPQPWTITSWEIELSDPIDRGAFGEVTKGVWLGHTKVAVKKLLIRLETNKMKQDFLKEIKTWYPLRHPHVMPLLGACSTADVPFMVVPMMENGSAIQYLKANAGQKAVGMRILYEVSQAMQYLHSRHVIHGDLKAANVLIDEYGSAFVSDFGFSKLKRVTSTRQTNSTRASTTSLRWMSPERLLGSPENLATDAYAFGMTAFEIITDGQLPFPDIHDDQLYEAVAIQRAQLKKPEGVQEALWRLVGNCSHIDPGFRPSFAAISVSMKSIYMEAEALDKRLAAQGGNGGGGGRNGVLVGAGNVSEDSGLGSSVVGGRSVHGSQAGKFGGNHGGDATPLEKKMAGMVLQPSAKGKTATIAAGAAALTELTLPAYKSTLSNSTVSSSTPSSPPPESPHSVIERRIPNTDARNFWLNFWGPTMFEVTFTDFIQCLEEYTGLVPPQEALRQKVGVVNGKVGTAGLNGLMGGSGSVLEAVEALVVGGWVEQGMDERTVQSPMSPGGGAKEVGYEAYLPQGEGMALNSGQPLAPSLASIPGLPPYLPTGQTSSRITKKESNGSNLKTPTKNYFQPKGPITVVISDDFDAEAPLLPLPADVCIFIQDAGGADGLRAPNNQYAGLYSEGAGAGEGLVCTNQPAIDNTKADAKIPQAGPGTLSDLIAPPLSKLPYPKNTLITSKNPVRAKSHENDLERKAAVRVERASEACEEDFEAPDEAKECSYDDTRALGKPFADKAADKSKGDCVNGREEITKRKKGGRGDQQAKILDALLSSKSTVRSKCGCQSVAQKAASTSSTNASQQQRTQDQVSEGSAAVDISITMNDSDKPCPVEAAQLCIVQHLLEMGADVHAGGNYALRFAARRGHFQLVKLLLVYGANPEAVVPIRNKLEGLVRKGGKVGGGPMIEGSSKQGVSAGPSTAIHQSSLVTIDNAQLSVDTITPAQNVQSSPPQLPAHYLRNILSSLASYFPLFPIETSSTKPKHPRYKISLLMQAVKANNIPLARLLVSDHVLKVKPPPTVFKIEYANHLPPDIPEEDLQYVSKISLTSRKAALAEALWLGRIEMAKLIIEVGGVKPSGWVLQRLLSRAMLWRVLCGFKERLTPSIILCIQHLPEPDLNNLLFLLTRTSCEIGSLTTLQATLEKFPSLDLNIQQGLPLYSTVYNGNLDITHFLLKKEAVDVSLFGWRQKGFCLGLIVIEGFAMLMFLMLILMWVLGIVRGAQGGAVGLGARVGRREGSEGSGNASQVGTATIAGGAGGNQTSENGVVWVYDDALGLLTTGVSVAEMSAMAIPSAVALVVLYRLVPFHRLCMGLAAVTAEQKRRARETEVQVTEVV
ncbi:hypothetical protein HDV05_005130 [Chytridiales sp. JEL 0842]|nr:hypothetical protein HDV05_005130 [Chytridiales sp. JEL 0842]